MDETPSPTPWEISPALRPERLLLLDAIVRENRGAVVEVTQDTRGDNRWVVGCRSYTWLGRRLKNLYEDGEHSWLVVQQVGNYLSVRIDGVPIRIYSGDPDGKPTERHLQAALRELERLAAQREVSAQKELFPEEHVDAEIDPDGWFWMMAVDTDDVGRVLRTGMLQAHETVEQGKPYKPRNVYVIDERLHNLTSMTPRKKPPASQPPVDIGLRKPPEAAEEDSDDGDDT